MQSSSTLLTGYYLYMRKPLFLSLPCLAGNGLSAIFCQYSYFFLFFPIIHLYNFKMIIKLSAVFLVCLFEIVSHSWGFSPRHLWVRMILGSSTLLSRQDWPLACSFLATEGRCPFVPGRTNSCLQHCRRSIFRPSASSPLLSSLLLPLQTLWFVVGSSSCPLASSPSFPKFPQEPGNRLCPEVRTETAAR